MTLSRLYRFAILLLLTAFFAVQTTSVAHAASFGDAPHEHDGQVCVLAVVSDQSAVAVVPFAQDLCVPNANQPAPYIAAYTDTNPATHPARAPPPRGPPATL